MVKYLNSVREVVEEGFCVGCGACALVDPSLKMHSTNLGNYQPTAVQGSMSDYKVVSDQVCPFSTQSKNETEISDIFFSTCQKQDILLGRYNNVYAGSVNELDYREKGSSGGLVTWLAVELMRLDMIDAVVHVKKSERGGEVFNYGLSSSIEAILDGAKTKYYPIYLTDVLSELKREKKRVLVVGVPCFIKAIRNLSLVDKELGTLIKFTVSLVCGHLKNKHFTNYLALNAGVDPNSLIDIDFRVPLEGRDAHEYGIAVNYKKVDGSLAKVTAGPVKTFFGEDWGLGFFKLKGCDFCDDVAGETADITIGDAWIPPYETDNRGTNILICRNDSIEKILLEGIDDNRIQLDLLTGGDFVQSQAGSYRHRREGLVVRAKSYQDVGNKIPKKRVRLIESVTSSEESLYKFRHKVSMSSSVVFANVLNIRVKHLFIFRLKMTPIVMKYYAMQTSWLSVLLPKRIKELIKKIKGQQKVKRKRAEYKPKHSMIQEEV